MSGFTDLSRRGLLRASLAGIAAAALATPALAALATETLEGNVRKLVQMHDEVVSEVKKSGIKFSDDKTITEEYHSKFNELLSFICDKFPAPTNPKELEQASADIEYIIRDKLDRSGQWRDTPPAFHPAAIGFSAVRSLLSVHRLRMEPSKLKTFERFADQYHELILDAAA